VDAEKQGKIDDNQDEKKCKAGKPKEIVFRKIISSTPQTSEENSKSMRILAKWIARAYAIDHPELFGSSVAEEIQPEETKSDQQENKSNESLAA
jgi:hypothetical protein